VFMTVCIYRYIHTRVLYCRALPLHTPARKIDAENVGEVERGYKGLAMSTTERTADWFWILCGN